MVFLGIDVGTSAVKALALDPAGKVRAQAREEYPVYRPQPGWAEQDPEMWWQATVQVIRRIGKSLRAQGLPVEALGLTGQMHGPVLLGRDDKPLGACILWMDTRATPQAVELVQAIGERRLLAITGNPAVAAFPAAKLLWLRQHRPEVHRTIRKILMPKDYIGFRLTGQQATDPSDASGSLLFDLSIGRWSETLMEVVGLPPEALPPIIRPTGCLGEVTRVVARQTGLLTGTSVFMGAGDLITAALGNGLVSPKQAAITLGTAGQLLFLVKEWPKSLLGQFYFFAYALPGTYLGLGTVPTGGAALQWLAGLLTEMNADSLAALVEQATRVPPGARGLIFLPYLAGTGTPHLDYRARGAFVGLTEAHGPPELVRALLEGVAYALQESLQRLQAEGYPYELRLAGGGMRLPLWTQIQADIYNTPIYPVQTLDASPLGACLLAAVGSGCYRTLEEAAAAAVTVGDPITPNPTAANVYRQGYKLFQQLYACLRETFPLIQASSSLNLEKGEKEGL